MVIFQIVSRTAHTTIPLTKRSRRLNSKWAVAIRVAIGFCMVAFLFVTILNITHNDYAFILLPALLSMLTVGSKRYSLAILLNSTPLYVLLSFCLSLVYYGFITLFVLLTHPAADTLHIILVAATLAWAVILDPVRVYLQGQIEQRFNVRNRETRKALEEFTSSLREEIDLDQIRERFLGVIQQALHPYTLSFWVRTAGEELERASGNDETTFLLDDSDPFVVLLLKHSGALDISGLQLTSPLLQKLQQNTLEIVLPLASRGELIGLLALGPRLGEVRYRRLMRALLTLLSFFSLVRLVFRNTLRPDLDDEEYTSRDLSILSELATQVAPALRVAQMVQEQQQEVRARERIEQELRTAQSIQKAFLPKEVPELAGWQLMPYYQPAREVGGDFYDFIALDGDRLALIIGDVTGKGVPAALVMATVLTMLRSAARTSNSPAEILARVNDLLVEEIPMGVFVTCFYALLDPRSGRLCYANAGHEAPYRCQRNHASELWATGMPLGILPGSNYEEFDATLAPGESLLFYSDGLVEAHSPGGEMFGFPRLQTLLSKLTGNTALLDFVLAQLHNFTGDRWEQEDDVTLLTLQWMPDAESEAIKL